MHLTAHDFAASNVPLSVNYRTVVFTPPAWGFFVENWVGSRSAAACMVDNREFTSNPPPPITSRTVQRIIDISVSSIILCFYASGFHLIWWGRLVPWRRKCQQKKKHRRWWRGIVLFVFFNGRDAFCVRLSRKVRHHHSDFSETHNLVADLTSTIVPCTRPPVGLRRQ